MRLRQRIIPYVELESLPDLDDNCDLPDDGLDEASDPEDNTEDYDELMQRTIEREDLERECEGIDIVRLAKDAGMNKDDYIELIQKLIEWESKERMSAGGDFDQLAYEREFTFDEPVTTLNDERFRVGNIVRERVGLKPEGRVDSLVEAFRLFMTPQMVGSIANYTNMYAIEKNPQFIETDWVEINALIGIMFMMGVQGDTKKAKQIVEQLFVNQLLQWSHVKESISGIDV